MTRSGAPFHGAIGAGSTAIWAASSQAADALWAWESVADKSTTNTAPATGKRAVTAAATRRVKNNGTPFVLGP
jgi:hypothetical protein